MSTSIADQSSESLRKRLLIIRFSSFGDIIQAAAVPGAFRKAFPEAKVDWLVRSDFSGLLDSHSEISRVVSFNRKDGIVGLLRLAWALGAEPYTHIYDAHANLRSSLVMFVLRARRILGVGRSSSWPQWARRPKSRLRRFLYFRLRVRSAFPQPFRGVISFLEPLSHWGVSPTPPSTPQFFTSKKGREEAAQVLGEFRADAILIPSAAWEMKRWPIEHWKQLIKLMPTTRFAILGGPEDSFCLELEQVAPDRVRNYAGRMTLAGSSAALERAHLTISGDTGLLHVADQLGRPNLALIGPTAFGYPTHKQSEVLEIDLGCKPCSKDGRGRCVNSVYKRCLVEVTPERVAAKAKEILASHPCKESR